MVLPVVLWVVGVLAATTVALTWNSSVSYQLSQNRAELAKKRAIGEAAINLAIFSLLDPQNTKDWRADGGDTRIQFNGSDIEISVQDEIGRIDLNYAPSFLLDRLLQSAGVSQEAAAELASNIVKWRSSSQSSNSYPLESELSRSEKRRYHQRGGQFQSVEELRLVSGIAPALFQKVKSALTVYSSRPQFDPQFAPREALLALPNMQPATADSIISARQRRNESMVPFGTSMRGRTYSVRAKVIEANGRTLIYQAVVRLTGSAANPYLILDWRTM